MKTIANIIHNKNFPLKILDSKGNTIYYEDEDGLWNKSEFDLKGNVTYSENVDECIYDNRP